MTKQISSSSTLIDKIIVPVFPIGLAILFSYITGHGPFNYESLPMLLFFSIPSVILFLQYRRVKKVEFDEHHLFASNFKSSDVYDLKDISDIKRTLFDFYIITIQTKNGYKKIKVLPSFHERMLNLFGEPKSITEFVNQIKKEKAVANKPHNA